MKNLKSLLAIAALLSGSTAVFAADLDVSTLSETAVETKDVSHSGVAGKSFIAGTIIDAPVTKLCAIIDNYADYPSFMPNTDKTVIVQATDASTVVDMTLKLPLGKIKKYRLRMDAKNGAQTCHLAWKILPRPELTPEETIADTSGYWDLSPLASDKNKTVVKYFVYSDPGPVPMGLGWIVDSLGKDSLPKTLEALRNKVRAH